jgi:NADH-quinone oxidoreductase subunit D
MRGETILSCVANVGYLPRGVEKIVESTKWVSITPFLDRLDYLAPSHTEHAYVTALECAMQIHVPERALYVRTIFDELTRIASHIMAVGCITHDIGMLSLFLYGFEEREKILEIFEISTGARMHLNNYIVGGLWHDLPKEAVSKTQAFIGGIDFYMEAVQTMALNNRIFKNRTVGIGTISQSVAVEYGLTGPNARASGVNIDFRKSTIYGAYEHLSFESLLFEEGDCYTRFKIRVLEIWQSISIIKQCLEKLPDGPINAISQAEAFELNLPAGSKIYRSVEGARGELGVFIMVDEDTTKPYRIHIRSPNFACVQLLEKFLAGIEIADVPAIIGSLDFVMGDCDR